MEFQAFRSLELDAAKARQLAVLLGRAYTDERHVRGFDPAERDLRAADITRVHAAPPAPGQLMPDDYLKRFPTIRNAMKLPSDRREAVHLIAPGEGYMASHVSLWSQYFAFDEMELRGGYIEDVATDPLHLGEGLAQEGMRQAARNARDLGLEVLGLATGLVGYYERLGWLPWEGGHTFHVAERGAAYPDRPLMLLPLSEAGLKLVSHSGEMRSWRMRRFDEVPPPAEVRR